MCTRTNCSTNLTSDPGNYQPSSAAWPQAPRVERPTPGDETGHVLYQDATQPRNQAAVPESNGTTVVNIPRLTVCYQAAFPGNPQPLSPTVMWGILEARPAKSCSGQGWCHTIPPQVQVHLILAKHLTSQGQRHLEARHVLEPPEAPELERHAAPRFFSRHQLVPSGAELARGHGGVLPPARVRLPVRDRWWRGDPRRGGGASEWW